jgi:dihydropteroate synthase-like protein
VAARERILFLTGRLAAPRLEAVLKGMKDAGFDWRVHDIGVKVAALMTAAIITRRLPAPIDATRVIVPGRCRLDLDALAAHYGVPFQRGPDEINDLPAHFGRGGGPPDLSRHDIRIFSEIVEAPDLPVERILERARAMRAEGADVIDVGCQPGIGFPHLEDTVRALKAEGFLVSVDSADLDELRRGAKAGADVVFSLTKDTLALAADTGVEAVLVPSPHGDLASLVAAHDEAQRLGLRTMADPILDPIHFGFTASLERYAAFRRERPEAEMLMGTGNLTELTEADTSGITALLLGVCSELAIRNVLIVQVSPHTRRTVAEHDAARRILYAARRDGSLPKGYGGKLLQVHDRRPYAMTPGEIARLAGEVRDRNFRIEVASDGIHVYSAAGHHVAGEALELFARLGVEDDGAHAFYLGTELMKAEIAFRLGKRYAQDEPLDWGAAADRREEDLTRLAAAGHTLRPKKDDA